MTTSPKNNSESPSPENGENKSAKVGHRPKGTPKTGGRTAPFTGLRPKEIREFLAANSDAVENLARMARGKPIRRYGPSGKTFWSEVDFPAQKWAIERVLERLAPVLKSQEIVGDPEKPLATPLEDRELARQVASMLYRAAPEKHEEPAPGVTDQRGHETGGAGLPQPAQPVAGMGSVGVAVAPDAPVPASLASPVLPAPDVAATAVRANGAGIFLPEPEAPPAGHVLRFLDGDVEILGCAPDRDNLPVIFELRSGGVFLIRGNFGICLSALRKQIGGDDLGPHLLSKQPKRDFAHRADAREVGWTQPQVNRVRPR